MKHDNKYRRTQPETLRVRALVPSLSVSDLEASVAWYRDTVGFYVKEAHEENGSVVGYTLVAGTQELRLEQDTGDGDPSGPKGVGLRFYLETIQDVDIIAAAIKKRGGKLASPPGASARGARAFDLVDPDGFAFTIVALA